jgi:molybdopterin synthase sulfur carrier subunit
MAKLLYFASLREALDKDSEQLSLPEDINTVTQLKDYLATRGARWQAAFTADTALLVSVNQQMAQADSSISDADEIAFFPPVTGG